MTEIIIHATGGPFCERGRVAFSPPGTVESIKRFFERSSAVSIHYIVGPDGEVARSVPEDEVAFHAVDRNDDSIGIELINAGDGIEPFPEKQIAALRELVAGIQKRWRIPGLEVKGHEDVDRSTFVCGGQPVRRKQDPGPLFPWHTFRQELRLVERTR
ncbi:MAG TPA: peptidoglycan recognition family protein [Hyphomicrobiaceae bacterium]|nr:peptidoglycan recognition family protein [Hyphomicrobiaceae bacterium]